MSLSISIEDPLSEDAVKLIEGSEIALRKVYREDECFSFTAQELAKPEISFFVARVDGSAVGCVAMCDYQTYTEVKRLFVPPTGRGKGIARALMDRLEAASRGQGHEFVRLETGEKLTSAVKLYQLLGYRKRGPFGEYSEHPASLFMEKAL